MTPTDRSRLYNRGWLDPQARSRYSPTSPVARLCEEWVQLNSRADTGPVVARWVRLAPALHGCRDLYDVVDAIHDADPEVRDQILMVLLRRAQRAGPRRGRSDATLAGRVVLQAMLQMLVARATARNTHFTSGWDDGADTWEDRFTRHLAAFWQVVSTYPLHRPRAGVNVPGWLRLETLRLVTGGNHARRSRADAARTHPAPADALERLAPAVDDQVDAGDDSVPDPDCDADQLLAWAAACGLPAADVVLLRRHYLDEVDAATLAAEAGVTPSALYRRLHRATDRLRSTVQTQQHALAAV